MTKTFGNKKICGKCNKMLPITEFIFRRKDKTGPRQSYCQGCKSYWQKNVGNPNRNKRGNLKSYSDYRKKNLDRVKKWAHRWYVNNKEKNQEWGRTYRKNNPERMRAKGLEYFHNRRATEIGVGGVFSDEDWNLVIQRLGRICIYCGSKDSICRDHFVPVTLGGPNCLGNIVPACKSCNSSKGNRNPEDWVINNLGREMYRKIVKTLNGMLLRK